MDNSPNGHVVRREDSESRIRLDFLLSEIESLQVAMDQDDFIFSGLVDLEVAYNLIEKKLDVAIETLTLHSATEEEINGAKYHVKTCLGLIDRLNSSELSVDQKDDIQASVEMQNIRSKFADVILSGGGPLFDSDSVFSGDAGEIGLILESAIMKHCDIEPDYDIEPGEEEIIESERMILPRSQAVILIREELIPALQDRLAQNPGDGALQKRIEDLSQTADSFESIRYFPQARPASFEKDIMTAKLAGFAGNGDPLVTLTAPILKSTGNRIERLRDMIRTEIITGIAGKGLHKETDTALKQAKEAKTGNSGSWTEPLSTVDTEQLYRSLAFTYPFLKRIDSDEELSLLADLGMAGNLKQLSSRIQTMMVTDKNYLMATEPASIEEPKAP